MVKVVLLTNNIGVANVTTDPTNIFVGGYK